MKFKILSREYRMEMREFIAQSPPKFKMLCVVFILLANIAGTTPYLGSPNYFITIWTWSLLADVVFIFTMSLCFFMTLRVAVNTKSRFTYFLSPLLTSVLVPIGFTISWFFVCIGTDFDGNRTSLVVEYWSIFGFIFPIQSSLDPDMGRLGYLMWGYNGLWLPAIFIAVIIFSSVQSPPKDAERADSDELALQILLGLLGILMFIILIPMLLLFFGGP